MFSEIDFDALDYSELSRYIIHFSVNPENIKNALLAAHLDIGQRYGGHVVRGIERERKAAPYPLFSESFQKFVRNYFLTIGGAKIETLTKSMTSAVMAEIAKAQDEGLTREEMVRAMRKKIDNRNYYRWQAMRIARTETTFAMNAAKQVAIEQSGLEMEKEWVHGHSASPRLDHLQMDGIRVSMNEPFILPGNVQMMYPGDDSMGAGAEDVINCTCTYVYVPKRDESGRLIEAGSLILNY